MGAYFKVNRRSNCTTLIEDCHSKSELVDEVVSAVREGAGSEPLNQNNLQKVVAYLIKVGAKPEDIVYGFCNQPQAASRDWFNWKSTVEMLQGFGVNVNQIVRIIAYNPVVLDYSFSRLQSLIDAMQATGISSSDLADRITLNPDVLNFNVNEIKRRHEALKEMFTNKDISKLVSKNLQVLGMPTNDVEHKLQYIVHRMGLDQPQVVHSEALTKPLQHLMERHQFLVRTGGYRTPNPKARNLSMNPQLKLIVDTTDNYFATKIAKVTLEEYQLFCRLAKERKNVLTKMLRPEDAEDEDESDSDEDSTDEQ